MDFKAQTKWRWGVAAYMFLVGLGAGAYVVGILADFRGPEWAAISKIGVALGFPCATLAGFIKLRQLGRPQAAWRAWMRPNTSWIARGSLILFAFLGISFLHLLLWVWPGQSVLTEAVGLRHAFNIVGGIAGVSLMVYTGILLTAARPIAFWSTAMVPLLFLVSGLLMGLMGIVLFGVIVGETFAAGTPLLKLQQAVVGMLIFEIVTIAIYLQSTHRVQEARASVARVLAGELAQLFWFGVVLAGAVLPLILGFFSLSTGSAVLAVLTALFGIPGGLFLRQVVLAGGIHAPLRAGSFQVALPIV